MKTMCSKIIPNSLATLIAIAAAAAPQAHAGETKFGSDGVVWTSGSGDSELRLGGRLHYDVVNVDEDITRLGNQNDFRRARIALSGRIAKDWRFRIENDVGGSSKGWKNIWLAYQGFDHWDIRAGHLVAPVGMESLMGSNDSPLMERSMASVLAPGFLTGAQATYARRGWTGTLGYYGNPIDSEQDSSGQDGHGVVGRLSYAPLRKKGRVLHVGTSFERRKVDPVPVPGGYRISARPGVGLADSTLIATGALRDVDRTTTWGVEAAAIAGPFSVLAERLQTRLDRGARGNPTFAGWHVTAAWTLTGEGRGYNEDTGAIGRIKPERRWGALELAGRYDELDLQDGTVSGGRERNLAVGLNWYVGENLRLMYNHVRAKAEPNKDGLDETVDIDQMRLQVDF